MKGQKRISGSVVRVPLDGDLYGYGLVLDEPLIAFFDIRASVEQPLDDIVASPVLFKLWVMNSAITRGRWEVVGKVGVPEEMRQSPVFFKKDAMNGKLTLYHDGQETPATREQCVELECAAVWEPQHVEDRLRDHFAGRPNKWVASLAVE